MNYLPKGFDWKFYGTYHKDLNETYNLDKEKLIRHYLYYGRFEQRKYCDIIDNFDWKYYLKKNNLNFNTFFFKEESINHCITNCSKKEMEEYVTEEIYEKRIIIVYYFYINHSKKWQNNLIGQMDDLKKSKILDVSKVFVILCSELNNFSEAIEIISKRVKEFNVIKINENLSEFPSIEVISEIVKMNTDKFFLYFHNRGDFYDDNSDDRLSIEMKLTNNTLCYYDDIIYILDNYPDIQKIMLFPSNTGYSFYNFWFARGSYLITCKNISETETDSIECEKWISLNSDIFYDCLSIYKKSIICYELKEVNILIENLFPRELTLNEIKQILADLI